ncbi:MAG: response regulator [Pseudomonadales bacterium]|nr:response regulator [Pseudomonadales bacterium]
MTDILVVDDSLSMRYMVSLTLEEANYSVTVAEDGEQGLQQAKVGNFDLVITDINMPVMDGLTLVSKLRELDGYRCTPMLVLTTESGTEKKAEGKAAGATGWIVKPFDPDKLLKLVARVVN